MTSENEQPTWIVNPTQHITAHMQKFKLYETHSNFYIIGRDKNRTFWRILKIDRLEPSELCICEDPVTYLEMECYDLLRRVDEGNKVTGGLRFITTCYGIVGFIKFLGPYYMLLITKRKKIGAICGHAVYAIAKSEIIPIPNSSVRSTMANSKNENRYKKLLCTVDLTKDFFFSYSYHLMLSLQKNLCTNETGKVVYEKMFVWNEFLTRGIRNCLSNTLWTVALIYGFFKQVKFSVSTRDFKLTLVARRSRHFAGTRYLKRGVNDKGRVANDVETEQIISEDLPEESLLQISSVVQNRGSIPLFWSQETSRLNIKPDIMLSRKDQNYEATRLHFKNLVKRYGNPIIVLNLIKSREKRPRESILRAEFANAIDFINKDLSAENRLKFLHWDLHKQSRNKDANVLSLLGKVAAYALNITGIFYCQAPQSLRTEGLQHQSYSCQNNSSDDCFPHSLDEIRNDPDNLEKGSSNDIDDQVDIPMKPQLLQKGVLRTNCIDCLDRTNVAQYAYGLVALGHQLHAVGFIDAPNIDLDAPLAIDLMGVYEMMGDTLALQYGGSGAHNKIFSERRGQWKAATQSQEFLRTLQRYYNNAYLDAEKQNAINVFLGTFQPRQDKPNLWELNSSQHSSIERRCPNFSAENSRSLYKRSLSDGNILCDSDSPPIALANVGKMINFGRPLPEKSLQGGLSESSPLISICESEISYSRFTPSMSSTSKVCVESDHMCLSEHGDDVFDCSNFLDIECLSSSGNSCEDDTYERSTVTDSPIESLSSENVVNGGSPSDSKSSTKKDEEVVAYERSDVVCEYPDSFVDWVTGGALLFY